MNDSIQFFETQFRKQLASSDLRLNPFETMALRHLPSQGRVLDFGCGLGNLSIAAARGGCAVLALDAAPSAVAHLAAQADRENLPIRALQADLRTYRIDAGFDAVVAIGLLMFFDRATALRQLDGLKACVRPGGVAIVNVLVEGTTYLDMFDPAEYYLFGRTELRDAFGGWSLVAESFDDRPAPADTVKRFATLVARKPASPSGP